MRYFSTLLFTMAFSSLPTHAGGIGDRNGGIYGVLGLDRNLMTFKGDSSHTDFTGYGMDAEAGVDLVSASDIGLNLAAIFRQSQGKNPSARTDLIETSEATGYGGKVGFIFSALTLGAGYQNLEVKTNNVATSSGYSETSLSGSEVFAFLNMTFNVGRKYRSTVELSYGQGTAGSLDLSTTSFSLKIGIIEPLK